MEDCSLNELTMDADKAEAYALQFRKLIACATISVKGSHDDTDFAKFRAVLVP